MTDWIVPCVIAGILLYGLWKCVDLYVALTCGLWAGLTLVSGLFPSSVTLLNIK